MAVSKAEGKKNKDMAALILKAQGMDYEEWLNARHLEVIGNNNSVLEEALAFYIKNQS
ncbi:hypothetical protein [Bacillus sp. Au-Bac7]|uniref:hypothetical protein n=1 Tax=Bacillus sp. Au-Bac7 TaxID=2906458 RepID=UPI001E55CE12|nr:hypothetical protein [Bacillus sp. Au-Bac7]MCE4051681.1 hypothetical protein [Bacillus sp. Au-Bac7]